MEYSITDIEKIVQKINAGLDEAQFGQFLVPRFSGQDERAMVCFFRVAFVKDIYDYNFKTRLTQDFYLDAAVIWLESFYPFQYGFEYIQTGKLVFPNGFDSWQETHYGMVTAMSVSIFMKGSLTCCCHEDRGLGGLNDLARKMTDEFERIHAGRHWIGDYDEELDYFIQIKNL